MDIEKLTERRLRIDGQKFWFTSMAFQDHDGKWCNCLYIQFKKEDFPMLKYPVLKDTSWMTSGKSFDYYNCSVADMDWHYGVTFYKETIDVESGHTIVKAGCDFQHLHDECYRDADHGEINLRRFTDGLAKEFLEIVRLESIGKI